MNKITEQDLANRGVKGLPDVPGLTTEEMQRKLEEIAREILIPKVNELVEGLNNANSNLTPVKNNLAGGYPTTEIDVYMCGKEQNISAIITFPIDVASANSYFTIAYAPISPASVNGASFIGAINYANKVIPAIYRITVNNDIQIFLSDEIVALGSVNALANINVSYRIT